jgi:hypothetical protein
VTRVYGKFEKPYSWGLFETQSEYFSFALHHVQALACKKLALQPRAVLVARVSLAAPQAQSSDLRPGAMMPVHWKIPADSVGFPAMPRVTTRADGASD